MPLYHQIVTPENIVIRYRLAGPASRALAFVYDCFFQSLLLFLTGIFCIISLEYMGMHRFLRGFPEALTAICCFLVFWGYHVVFEVFRRGQTPGKKTVGIRVISADSPQVDFFPSLTRNLLRVVDFLPSFFVLGVTTMVITPNHQRFGDLLARTLVIIDTEAP